MLELELFDHLTGCIYKINNIFDIYVKTVFGIK